MDRLTEVRIKEERIQQYLQAHGLDGLILARHENFAWLTGGASDRIVMTEETGPVYLVVTKTGRYAVTNASEASRVADEQLDGLGYQVHACRWDEDPVELLHRIPGLRMAAADVALQGAHPAGAAFRQLRYSLTEREEERYRKLCRISAESVVEVCRTVEPGETENQVGGRLAALLAPHGITPSVVLAAADERIFRYRHPLPTDKVVDKYLMLVLVAEQAGLHAALTRFVHFGPLPAEVEAKLQAVAGVGAAFQAATRPGARVADIFEAGLNAYAAAGFPDEWQLHHQGGAIGYAPREYLATAYAQEVVADRQAFAWNPSITGAKVEDTILATAGGAEVLTDTAGWPVVAGQAGILVR